MDHIYRTVFDVSANPEPRITGVLTVATILIIVSSLPFAIGAFRLSRFQIAIQIVLGILGISLLAGPIVTRSRFRRFVRAYREGHITVTEGVVENFKPMPVSYRDFESFTVGNERFTYNDFRMTPGFHQSQVRGGPIHCGLIVRIYHIGNDIARLDIAEESEKKEQEDS